MSPVTPWLRPLPDTRGYVIVRLERGLPAHSIREDLIRQNLIRQRLGYALPMAQMGAHAIVFYDRVENLYFRSGGPPTVESLLGAAMAHEIGHVLLGSRERSAHGIMKANLGALRISTNSLQEASLHAGGRCRFASWCDGPIGNLRKHPPSR